MRTVLEDVYAFGGLVIVADAVAELFETRVDFVVVERHDEAVVVDFPGRGQVFLEFQMVEHEYIAGQYDFIVQTQFKASGPGLYGYAQIGGL